MTARCALSNLLPTSAYRGAGRPEAAFAIERSMDLLARRLRVDPTELRRRNFLRPDEFPYETPTGRVYDSGNYAAALDEALEVVGYADVRAQQGRRRREGGRPLGVGLATYVERSGAMPHSFEYGAVEACPDGSVVARTGSQATEQGHLTALAQVVASALDLDLGAVRVLQGDTAEVPDGFGSFGSRSMQVGAYAAVVEIDPELGTVTVARLVAVDDYGVVVNPLLVDGQGYGSATQGLGQALTEVAEAAPDGTPSTTSLLDYLLPTAADVPPVRLLETRTPNPNQPFGAKGAGEAGCIGVPPAVVNAVCDTLDVDHVDLPLAPKPSGGP